MLQEAGRNGYKIGKREKAQLAEGYRARGENMYSQAQKMPSLKEQENWLGRADDDLARAEDLYRDVVPAGNSVSILRRISDDRDAVAQRKRFFTDLSKVPEPAPPSP